MATIHEVLSFSSKFAHLSSLGLRADLHFSCINGNVFTNFHADLGCLDPPYLPQKPIQPSKVKPSKLRRRQKRRERARILKQSSVVNSTEVEDEVEDPEVEPSFNPNVLLPVITDEQLSSNSDDNIDSTQPLPSVSTIS